MIVNVAGANEQGAVDRQRSLTAPWMGLELVTAPTKPRAAKLERDHARSHANAGGRPDQVSLEVDSTRRGAGSAENCQRRDGGIRRCAPD